MLAASALYHRWNCSPRVRSVLCRIDHSAIYVFVAASYTPVGLLVLDGTLRWVVLGTVWAGALAGVALSVAWITAPRVLFALTYLGLGWVLVIAARGWSASSTSRRWSCSPPAACSTRPAPSSTRYSGPTRGRARSASTRSSTRWSSPPPSPTSWRSPAG